MAEDLEYITEFGDETYTQDEIDANRRKTFKLEKINNDGTIADMVRTINGNFQNIAAHGGGPAGKDGSNGLNGTDGTNVEYIYARCDALQKGVHYPSDISEYGNLFDRVKYGGFFTYKTLTWYDHPQGVTNEHKNEYVLTRVKRTNDEYNWAYFETPVLWAHWGETGADGDGVEYVFKVSQYELTENECKDSILKIDSLDSFQKVIYQINDFYPGKDWFNNDNRELVLTAFDNAGIRGNIGTNEFETRWHECFGMDYGWTDEPVGTSPINKYEYVAIRKSNTDENDKKTWGDYSTPVIWSNYGLPSRTFIVYCNTSNSNVPQTPKGGWWDVENDCLIKDKENYVLTPNTWSDTNVDEPGKIAWISYGIFDNTGNNVSWSSPFRITGEKGEKGVDGDSIQFIYALTDLPIYPDKKVDKDELFNFLQSNDSKQFTKNNRSTTWYNNAQPIDKDNRTEYVWSRFKQGNDEWTYYPSPTIWAHWGEDGTDGDGIEYVFRRTETNSSPGSPSTADYNGKTFTDDDFIPEDWTDNPTGVSKDYPYEWVSIRKSIRDADGKRTWNTSSTPFSAPALWAKFSKDGASSRVFIVYCNIPTDMVKFVIKPTGGFWNTSYGLALDSNNKTEPYKCDALSTMPSNPDAHTCVWEDSDNDVENTITYISSGVFSDTGVLLSWTEPQRITGERGERGADGSSMEFIYTRDIDSVDNYPNKPSTRNALFVNVEESSTGVYEGWYDHPQGVDASHKFEYCASRTLPLGADEWIPIDTPFIWSHYGEDGTDGDGIEYVFTRTRNETPVPSIDTTQPDTNNRTVDQDDYVPTGWTDNPTGVDSTWLYEWVSIRRSHNENGHRVWDSFSTPAVWAKYGEQGPQGVQGNGYQYYYARYDNNHKSDYGDLVTASIYNINSEIPTFKINNITLPATSTPQGVNSSYLYEYRSERSGYGSSWGSWSTPVTIAKYLTVDNIQGEINDAVTTATSKINTDLTNALSRVNTLSGYFDSEGNLKSGIATSLLSGYITYNSLSNSTIQSALLAGVTVDTSTVNTFAELVNYQTGQITNVETSLNAIDGRLTNAVAQLSGFATIAAFQSFHADVNSSIASINQTVTNASYLTNESGYLVVDISGSRRPAQDNNGEPTSSYMSVRDTDLPYLVSVVNELATIKQSVGKGIACAEILVGVGDNAAKQVFQASEEGGSQIYMMANEVGISSDYFTLDNSGLRMSNYFTLDNTGLEMTGNLLAKDSEGNITAGVIGENTGKTDIKFFAGTSISDELQSRLSPVTHQEILQVEDESENKYLFVRYPDEDTTSDDGEGEYNVYCWAKIKNSLNTSIDEFIQNGVEEYEENKGDKTFIYTYNENINIGSTIEEQSFYSGEITVVDIGTSINRSLTSAPFQVYENGHIVAKDIELTATNAKIGPMEYDEKTGNISFGFGEDINTWIDSDGRLHATGADIDLDITAESFRAQSVVGGITKQTIMNGEAFSISLLDGSTITDSEAGEHDVSGNAIYIKIIDKLSNPGNEDLANELYGVPALCMYYGGEEYVLSPVSWVKNTRGGQKYDTDMGWREVYHNVKGLNIKKNPSSDSRIIYVNSSPITYRYSEFKTSNRNTYVDLDLSTNYNPLYRLNLTIDSRDIEYNTYFSRLKTYGLVNTSNEPAYTLGNYIGNNDYIDDVSELSISNLNCINFASCLPPNNVTNFTYAFERFNISINNSQLNNLLKTWFCGRGEWVYNAQGHEDNEETNAFYFSNSELTGLFNNGSSHLMLSIYPKLQLTNYGKSLNNSVTACYVQCTYYNGFDYGNYDGNTYYQTSQGKIFGCSARLSFDYILEFDNPIIINSDNSSRDYLSNIIKTIINDLSHNSNTKDFAASMNGHSGSGSNIFEFNAEPRWI